MPTSAGESPAEPLSFLPPPPAPLSSLPPPSPPSSPPTPLSSLPPPSSPPPPPLSLMQLSPPPAPLSSLSPSPLPSSTPTPLSSLPPPPSPPPPPSLTQHLVEGRMARLAGLLAWVTKNQSTAKISSSLMRMTAFAEAPSSGLFTEELRSQLYSAAEYFEWGRRQWSTGLLFTLSFHSFHCGCSKHPDQIRKGPMVWQPPMSANVGGAHAVVRAQRFKHPDQEGPRLVLLLWFGSARGQTTLQWVVMWVIHYVGGGHAVVRV